jgi:hypothetical protein
MHTLVLSNSLIARPQHTQHSSLYRQPKTENQKKYGKAQRLSIKTNSGVGKQPRETERLLASRKVDEWKTNKPNRGKSKSEVSREKLERFPQ